MQCVGFAVHRVRNGVGFAVHGQISTESASYAALATIATKKVNLLRSSRSWTRMHKEMGTLLKDLKIFGLGAMGKALSEPLAS